MRSFLKQLSKIISSKIQYKLFLSFFVIITLFILVIGAVNSTIMVRFANQNISEAKMKTIQQVKDKFDSLLDEMNFIMNRYYVSDEIQSLIYKIRSENDVMKIKLLENRIYEIISSFNNDIYMKYSYDTIIVTNNRSFVSWGYDSTDFAKLDSLKLKLMEHIDNNRIVWMTHVDNPHKNFQSRYAFGGARTMQNIYMGEKYGMVMVSCPKNVLFDLYANILGPDEDFYVLDKENRIISTNEQNPSEDYLKSISKIRDERNENSDWFIDETGSKKVMVFYSSIKVAQWKIVDIVPMDIVLKDVNILRYTLILLFILCLILATVLIYIISNNITLPIKVLCKNMQDVMKGNFDINIEVSTNDETQTLTTVFCEMIGNIKNLMSVSLKQEKAKRELETKFLQAQINPHFINNTLNTIKTLARLKKWKDISTVIAALSKILKNTISNTNELITIKEEMEIIRSYLDIQYISNLREFNYNIEIDESIMKYRIPKLVLQPLIENCIFHGYNKNNTAFFISIKGIGDEGFIEIDVTDNGKGMNKKRLEEVIGSFSVNDGDDLHDIGLKNVYSRLNLYYNGNCAMSVSSRTGFGTSVKIRICKEKEYSNAEGDAG